MSLGAPDFDHMIYVRLAQSSGHRGELNELGASAHDAHDFHLAALPRNVRFQVSRAPAAGCIVVAPYRPTTPAGGLQ